MTTYNAWSRFFVAAALAVSGLARGDFRFSLEPSIIQPGQRAFLTLRLSEKDLLRPEGTKEEDLFPEADDEWLLKNEELELLGQDYRKENGEYVWRYQFTSYDTGEISIPAISVRMGPQSFSTERRTLQVVSDRQDAELLPNAGPVSPPWNWGFWLACLAVGSAAFAAYWYGKKAWNKRTPTPMVPLAPPPPEEAPREWLKKQLLVLRARIESHPHEGRWPDVWTQILKEFTSREAHVPALAWTTPEMQGHLEDDSRFVALSQLLRECDVVKFSSRPAPASLEKMTLKWIEESERIFL